MSIVSGNGQLICSLCPTASFVFDPLVVALKDARGNPVPNAVVSWSITTPSSVSGSVGSATTATGADGTSTNTIKVSPPLLLLQPFVQATVTATAMGSTVTFTETNSASANGTGVNLVGLTLVSPPAGTVLTGAPGSISSVPIQVQVRSFSPSGPVPGVEIRLVSDASEPATAVCTGNPLNSVLTDANGNAVCNVQFGNAVGAGRVKVWVGGSFGTFGPIQLDVTQGSTPGPSGGAGSLSATPNSLSFLYPGSAPLTQNVSVKSSSGSVSYTAAVQVTLAAVTWLSVGAPSGPATSSASSTFSVTINPQNLSPGAYYASVGIHPDNGTPDLAIPIQLTIQPSGAPSQLTATPNSLTFQYPGPLAQTVNIGGTGGVVTYTATVQASVPAAAWLVVGQPTGPVSSSTQSSFQVSIVPQALPPGTSHANIIVHPANGTGDLTIPVQATLVPGELTAAPSSLIFQYPGPVSQSVSVSSTGGSVTYTAAVQITLAAVNWLTVGSPTGPASANSQSSFTVSLVTQNLTPGTYRAAISIHPNNGSADVVVPVTATVGLGGGPAQLAVNSGTLTFLYPGQVTQSVAVGSTGAAVNYTATVQPANPPATWLAVSQSSVSASSVAPSTLQVSVTPQSLAAGSYHAIITLHPDNGTADVPVPVQLTVQQAGGTTQLTANPGSISFQYPGNLSQTLAIGSTGASVTYSVSVQPPVSWLAVGSPSGPASTTASSLPVSAAPQSLASGSYQAIIILHPGNGAPDVTVPVQLTVAPPAATTVSVFPGNLSLSQAAGGVSTPAGAIAVTSSGPPVQFSASSGASWLTVTPTSGMTPGQVVLSINATGLAPGSYSAAISITAPGAVNALQSVTINLTVQASQSLTLSGNSLTFTSQAGSDAPAPQTLSATASGGSLAFTVLAAVATPIGGSWLSTTPSTGTASNSPASVTVSVNPAGLAPGTYLGTITLFSPGAVNSTQSISVTYVVTPFPVPVLANIVNFGSNAGGAVSPGEILSITGSNLGPAAPVSAVISGDGFVQTLASDTQVTFDDIPAPLMLVSANQINVVVPYAIAGRTSTRVVVTYKGSASAVFNLDVTDAAPGIFTDQSGRATAWNGDGTANAAANAAARETVISVYATGEGLTTPDGVDGEIIPLDSSQWKQPVLQVTATIGGVAAQVQYAGSAPQQVSGTMQLLILVPDDAPSGDVPLVITVGAESSPPATISIQ